MVDNEARFRFAISLSVLNHLGRNLYRSFATILGEAISNSWDADADNVWIDIDKDNASFVIRDDGVGMTADEFQQRFLKIGYSKRTDVGGQLSGKGRPFIGRKGIGKLALLSCAENITVLSKTADTDFIGGTINNSELDDAIQNDLEPDQYPLEDFEPGKFEKFVEGLDQGTIIRFDDVKEGIRNSFEHLEMVIALYFRFALLDDNFRIFVNDNEITLDHLSRLAEKTQFVWKINGFSDPYIDQHLNHAAETRSITTETEMTGFIASVVKPSDLTIRGMDERVTVDLFVNGRLREKNILTHIPTNRVPENYVYGQIHFDGLDDEEDRFTSSREGVKADDSKYTEFLESFRREVLLKYVDEWDKLRIQQRQDGDAENPAITPRVRKSGELANIVFEEFEPPENSKYQEKVKEWSSELHDDAAFNFSSYADCFVSENLVRKYIESEGIEISPEAVEISGDWKNKEKKHKEKANLSIELRQSDSDLSYLTMRDLVSIFDKYDADGDKKNVGKDATLMGDAIVYKPIRDALMHTALLTDDAKHHLIGIYLNIRARIQNILNDTE